jgi:hypothetical protein
MLDRGGYLPGMKSMVTGAPRERPEEGEAHGGERSEASAELAARWAGFASKATGAGRVPKAQRARCGEPTDAGAPCAAPVYWPKWSRTPAPMCRRHLEVLAARLGKVAG